MRRFFVATVLLSIILAASARAQTDPDQRRAPLLYPFARGALAKLDLPAHTIAVHTDIGLKDFLLAPTTYIFRGKQKITPDQLKLGELVKLNYATNELGQAIARRIKVAPMKKALVPLAPGFEEIEAITIIDILRRAGVAVTVAGTVPGPIEAARKTRHLPDCLLDDVRAEDFDIVILPGGQPGATNLRHSARLRQILQTFRANGRHIAAICAAPTVLAAYGILQGRAATCHPGSRAELAAGAGAVSDQRVVEDGVIITSQSAGTAMEFAFKLVEILCGAETAAEVNKSVLAPLRV